MKVFLLLASLQAVTSAQTLLDCRSIAVESMPEAMDRFASAKLVQWGKVKVVRDPAKADCVLSFPRQQSRIDVKSSGSAVVPKETEVASESQAQQLPRSRGLFSAAQATFELVHRESSAIIWANSTSENEIWFEGGPKGLAEKLVGRLRKDYEKHEKQSKKMRR